MRNIIQEVHNLLLQQKKTIAVAESCTGGELSKLLTEIKGSSQYFILGVVVYSNFAKEKILKIPSKVIQKEGPVAKKTTQLLASNIRKIALADIGIGITGIAGPTGELKGKPKGTVFIAIETKNKSFCRCFLFKGSRATIRKRASLKALEILKRILN
jgi:nicotinamide-nucleotide amidase